MADINTTLKICKEAGLTYDGVCFGLSENYFKENYPEEYERNKRYEEHKRFKEESARHAKELEEIIAKDKKLKRELKRLEI